MSRAAAETETATTDLKNLVTSGRNRIVITQVDWCPVGNQLQSAQVQLNGSRIAAAAPTQLGPFLPISHGDVHIRSTDGMNYDFQAAGDYLMLQSTDGEVVVQSRQEMWDQNPKVSVNRAGAMRVMGDKIEWYMRPARELYLNGKPIDLPTAPLALPAGGRIELLRSGSKQTLMVYWPNESFTGRMVAYSNDTMDVEVRKIVKSPRSYEGLIGNMDGNRSNQLQIRGGDYLPPKPTAENVARMGESWRVRASESLFTRSHPAPVGATVQSQPGIADLDPAARQDANQTCKTAGITDATALRHCTYDVAATGDRTFVESAQQFQQTVAALPAAERAGETVEPAHVQAPPVAAATPGSQGPGLLLPGEKLQRGTKYSMAGHHLIFQEDGNLCVYRTAGAQWVWCINNDPNVSYQRSAAVEMTRDGQLRVSDADGAIVWQAPAANAQPRSSIHLTESGTLELRAPSGAVLWSSR